MSLAYPIEQIEFDLKKIKDLWLSKKLHGNKKMQDIALIGELNCLFKEIKLKEELQAFKLYVKHQIALDANVKFSANTMQTVSFGLVTIMLTFITVPGKLGFGTTVWIDRSLAIATSFMAFGVILVTFEIVKQHFGKYAREKSFYQACLYCIEEIENDRLQAELTKTILNSISACNTNNIEYATKGVKTTLLGRLQQLLKNK